MIINIEGNFETNSGKLLYKVPSLFLDKKYNFKIGLKFVHLEMLERVQIDENEIFSIDTNLIDTSSTNPTQTIYFFWNRSKLKAKQSSFVNEITFFPLQVYEIENCQITFKKFFSGEVLPVQKFILQLHIKRSDILNGRFL